MSYTTYITDALVCGGRESNTSDKSYMLFTREAGMLFASARSVREERSRQRFALQEFALIRATLIKGKSGWRIGSVEALDNYYNTAQSKEARGSVALLFRYLRRFIHGEEAAESLFDFVVEALDIVRHDVKDRAFADMVIQVRLLELLGYVSKKDIPETLTSSPLQELLEASDLMLEKRLRKVLEHSHSVSHL